MRIGELAEQLGIKPSAIRFYEASGLLPPGARGLNGYRDYGPEDLKRLQTLQLAQRLGFPLDALRGLFARGEQALPQAEVLSRLQARRSEIAQLRRELDAQDAEIASLIAECERAWAQGECVALAPKLARNP